MKTIVYLCDGSIEATSRHAEHVAAGRARYATAAEERSYNRSFERDDARALAWEESMLHGDSGPSQPSYDY